MKTRISNRTLMVPAAAACFVILFAAALGIPPLQEFSGFAIAKAKAKANSEPNTPNKTSVEPNKPAKAVANEPNTPPETAADSVAVTVNGVNINESQVEAQLKPQLKKMGAQLPSTFVYK